MTAEFDNNQFELPRETPTKKRKRNENRINKGPKGPQQHSTPKKAFENPIFLFQPKETKKSINTNYFGDPCMEIKSISDLLAAAKTQSDHLEPRPASPKAEISAANPYEVTRKPPKKKKRQEFEDSCFINPGLDLNGPEKSLNPYEVSRQVENGGTNVAPNHCFSNPGLNLCIPDRKEQINPFEIKRLAEVAIAEDIKGIENLALEVPPQQKYALAVPFTPSLNRRINFSEISPSALTPCEMLSKKLVISSSETTPQHTMNAMPPKILSVISEEAVDIGEELDCYQLELENSINEAKMMKQTSRRRTTDMRHISNLSQKLQSMEEEEGGDDEIEIVEESKLHLIATPNYKLKPISRFIAAKDLTPKNSVVNPQTKITKVSKSEISLNIKDASHHIDFDVKIQISDNSVATQAAAAVSDVEYEELDENEADEEAVFNKPAPFRRAYRKDPVVEPKELFKMPDEKPASKGMKGVIRSSIRRLMHPHSHKTKEDTSPTTTKEEPTSLFQAIRHSFRRKAKNEQPETVSQQEKENVLNVTVIDDVPRKVYRQPIADVQEKRVEISTERVERQTTTTTTASTFARGGSLRMRKQVMKTVFKKSVDEFDMM